MNLSKPRIQHYLKEFKLRKLFIEELGWDRYSGKLTVHVDGITYTLEAIAEKRGVQILLCRSEDKASLPGYAVRRKIEKQVARSAYEHLVIFHDADQTVQIWQWVSRRPGLSDACREHHYYPRHQSGDALIQKLELISFSLNEEEGLTLAGITFKLRDAFDRDKITKKFFDHFKKQHQAFLKFIKGITETADREWYASLMLNRLMFIYFIQKKGFLDGDPGYLKNRLEQVKQTRGKGKFHSFYRYFLLRLFHEGLGQQPAQRKSDLEELLGGVPYLNGGLFDPHELEQNYSGIDIPDEAFENLFAFFDQYEWHLDNRPLSNDKEINPDVLGYIFEKYINQKQMGAYYTKEDITEYISKNTIIPYLFDAARKKCKIAFHDDSALWRLLKNDPIRYIYPAMRKGVVDEDGEIMPLPETIARGIDNVDQRGDWNQPADAEYALPTETWREHVARRRRCLEIRDKLLAGEIREINDLITYNLDIRQFAEDAVVECEGPELLRAFYKAISSVTVLDPTCGSGAFLFAALNILEPLYDACLDRMQGFIDDLDHSGEPHRPEKFSDFRNTLKSVDDHPNRRFFILKSIVVNNLYGVDIMEEAVEICKLRLFLKLVAQVDKVHQLEPLPDIDFNIRPGNTLVGFVSVEDIRKAAEYDSSGQSKILLADTLDDIARIEEDANLLEKAFNRFHEMQTLHGMDAGEFREAKEEYRNRLNVLAQQLDEYLAKEYKVNPDKKKAFEAWRKSHQPFHWFIEFYGIMRQGGFDVVIGNPPYVEYSKVRKYYSANKLQTISCGNLYALCTERSYQILCCKGRFGFIVQAPVVSTQRMQSVRKVLKNSSDFLAFSTYDDRPSKLFDGMHHCRLAIILSRKQIKPVKLEIGTTRYYKWYKEERPHLFQTISYMTAFEDFDLDIIPKLRSECDLSIYEKVHSKGKSIGHLISLHNTEHRIYYKITGVGHWFTYTFEPPKFWRNGKEGKSTREASVSFQTSLLRDTAYCCLYSSLHYWLYQTRTNCRDFNPSDIRYLPIPDIIASGIQEFSKLANDIMKKIEETSDTGTGHYSIGGSVKYQRFRPKSAKSYFDEIDRILSKHYDFNDEELDFIINYDIKYRMG